MANDLGQPTAQEIAEKFCTEMLCNALLCEGCFVYAIKPAAQQSVQRICRWAREKFRFCESGKPLTQTLGGFALKRGNVDKEDFRKLLVQWASEDVYINQLTWEEGDALAEYLAKWYAAQQNMHWTAGIVRRFKQFSVVKFILSLWHSLASRQ